MIIGRLGAASAAAGMVLFLAACGGEEKHLVAPVSPPAPAVTSETTVTSAPAQKTEPVSPSIAVSEDIARACSLSFDNIDKAPKFEFDKAELLPADHEVLGKIGQCVLDGPLKGRTIRLVGRADPRGTQEYNMALGARRANAVAAFLGQFGLDSSRLMETSRGELDAIGSDEATWQIDRRVDIVLVE